MIRPLPRSRAMARTRWSLWVAVLAVQATLSPGVYTDTPLASQAALNEISAKLQRDLARSKEGQRGQRVKEPRPPRAPEEPGKPPLIPLPAPPPTDDPNKQPNSSRPTVNDLPPVNPPSSDSSST